MEIYNIDWQLKIFNLHLTFPIPSVNFSNHTICASPMCTKTVKSTSVMISSDLSPMKNYLNHLIALKREVSELPVKSVIVGPNLTIFVNCFGFL